MGRFLFAVVLVCTVQWLVASAQQHHDPYFMYYSSVCTPTSTAAARTIELSSIDALLFRGTTLLPLRGQADTHQLEHIRLDVIDPFANSTWAVDLSIPPPPGDLSNNRAYPAVRVFSDPGVVTFLAQPCENMGHTGFGLEYTDDPSIVTISCAIPAYASKTGPMAIAVRPYRLSPSTEKVKVVACNAAIADEYITSPEGEGDHELGGWNWFVTYNTTTWTNLGSVRPAFELLVEHTPVPTPPPTLAVVESGNVPVAVKPTPPEVAPTTEEAAAAPKPNEVQPPPKHAIPPPAEVMAMDGPISSSTEPVPAGPPFDIETFIFQSPAVIAGAVGGVGGVVVVTGALVAAWRARRARRLAEARRQAQYPAGGESDAEDEDTYGEDGTGDVYAPSVASYARRRSVVTEAEGATELVVVHSAYTTKDVETETEDEGTYDSRSGDDSDMADDTQAWSDVNEGTSLM